MVDASIQQMRAYGDLVQQVAMSLSDFRDANVTENQGRDHLVSKYPQLFQINVNQGQPRVGLRPGADDLDELPDFQTDLGLGEQVTSLDDDTAEEKLVLAARNDLAKSRQSLLATMLLMGINRIVVTDGKINAKLNFNFHASDSQQTFAQTWDYKNMGTTTVTTSSKESSEQTGENYAETGGSWFSKPNRSGDSQRWSRGIDTTTSAPVINLTGASTTQTEASIDASGSLKSEVTLNFKSDVVDLNKLATSSELFQIQQNQRAVGGGRGAPAPGGAAGGTAAVPPQMEQETSTSALGSVKGK